MRQDRPMTRERAQALLDEAEADLALARQWHDKAWIETLTVLVSERRLRVRYAKPDPDAVVEAVA